MQDVKLNEEILLNTEELYEKNQYYLIFKRIIDVIGSVIGLVLFSPVFFVVAAAIKLDSKGPVFFTQDRVGQNGRIFKMYKFRSMVTNAEDLLHHLKHNNEMSGPMFKMKEDPRITDIGRFIRKTSIDELPQLYNVLKGDMSIVGPRPNLPSEVAQFKADYKVKLIARPGLTCYWQIHGRNDIDFDDWMKLDLKYLQDRNTLLDIKLIFKTFKVFLGDENAS